jgi:oligogalacturonide lyase
VLAPTVQCGPYEIISVVTRRMMLFAGATIGRLYAATDRGATFPSDSGRYPDPLTSIDVYRLTSPQYSTSMTAYYNRGIAHNSSWMLCSCDRGGSPQPFHLDLKTGEMKQLTQAEGLDGTTLTLTPDNRSFVYATARSIWHAPVSGGSRDREIYKIAEGWDRAGSISVGPDGTHVTLVERKGETSRLRMLPLAGAAGARTVIEAPVAISDPIPRPMRAQILYRQGADEVWMVNMDGAQNRRLKLAPGGVGTPNWSTDGRTILYLNFPEDKTQLNNLREFTPDAGTDKMIGKTSQFASFGANRDASVFVGASRNTASPAVLLFVRSGRGERTLCEHKSRAEWVSPVFSPDSQRIYFQSDRHGKPAIYSMHVEKLVEKTEANQ